MTRARLDGLTAWRERFDRRLVEWLPADPLDQVGAAMHWSLLGPGKRLRPMMMFAIGIDLGIPEDRLIDSACAVEMVHAASLVLDDLPCMDDATERRGRACTHVAHGQSTALLATVALLGRAFAAAGHGVADDGLRLGCVALLAGAVGPDGLVRGQSRDLARRDAAESDAAACCTDDLKTGCLFDAAFGIAALIGRADAPTTAALGRFAHAFGRAFQSADDIADRDAPSSQLDTRARLHALQAQAGRSAVEALGAGSTLALVTREAWRHG